MNKQRTERNNNASHFEVNIKIYQQASRIIVQIISCLPHIQLYVGRHLRFVHIPITIADTYLIIRVAKYLGRSCATGPRKTESILYSMRKRLKPMRRKRATKPEASTQIESILVTNICYEIGMFSDGSVTHTWKTLFYCK